MSTVHAIFVDDEPAMHMVFQSAFARSISLGSFMMYNFLSGQECLEFLNERKPEGKFIVFTDINMPEMDGFTLMEKISKRHPEVAIWVLSAYNDPDFVSKAESLGAVGFLGKPVSFKKIQEIIETFKQQ